MSNPDDLYAKGNEAFVAEQYSLASDFYTQAIAVDPAKPDYFANRANSNLKLKKYEEAKSDVNKVLEFGKEDSKLWMWKGMACFQLQQYKDAENAFLEGMKLDNENKDTLEMWLDKCKIKLQEIEVQESKNLPPPPVKIRHDWYQTETSVVVTILVKNVKENEIFMKIESNSLRCKIEGNEQRMAYELDVQLARAINPQFSTWKILPSKIEIQMKKAEGLQWTTLHETEKAKIKQFIPDLSSNTTVNYPTSCSKKKDWDKIVVEIKKDEESEQQGEAAVNQLFQKIYSEGSDEVKKAMNKSFTESGGTVLSTNWGDVGKKKITIKPPDGMEWKKWDS